MAHPLRRGMCVATSRLPVFTAILSDGLAILIALTGLIAGGAISRGDDLPDSVLLDFTATWCGPCQRMSPIVHKLQQQGYPIQKVDVDQQPKLAKSYSITSIPTFVLVVNGQEVNRITGPTSEEQLRRMAQQAAQPPKQQPKAPAIPLPANSRLAAADDEGELPFDVQLGNPHPAPASSVGLAKDRRQPSVAAPKSKLFPSLFPKKKPAPVADRNPSDDIKSIRGQNENGPDAPLVKNLPLSASVRLIVSDATGSNFGSGTIIDSRVGRTTILTCGHLFKSQQSKSEEAGTPLRIEVDLFLPGGRRQTYPGQLVDFDLAGDVGIVTIETAGQLPISPIAPLAELPVMNDRLLSVGCGGGERPTAEPIRVTAINRYDGPENIECTGVPIQGRSGGGLFDTHGQIVGVCIAADQEGQRGLYASLPPIHDLLARAGLKQLTPPSPTRKSAEPQPVGVLVEAGAADHTDSPVKPEDVDSFLNRAFGEPGTEPLVQNAAPSPAEINRLFQQSPDAEVICIVRPKNGDSGRVVIVNQASTKFVSYLLDSLETPREMAPRAASFRVEDHADPLGDEWVADDVLGVPKQAPDFSDVRQSPPSRTEFTGRSSKRFRFGSRSEN